MLPLATPHSRADAADAADATKVPLADGADTTATEATIEALPARAAAGGCSPTGLSWLRAEIHLTRGGPDLRLVDAGGVPAAPGVPPARPVDVQVSTGQVSTGQVSPAELWLVEGGQRGKGAGSAGGGGGGGGGGAFAGPCRLAAIASTARLRATHAPYPAAAPPALESEPPISRGGGQVGGRAALTLTLTLILVLTLT